MSRYTPKSMKQLMADAFDPAEMGPGLRRGMVLRIYKAKIQEVVGSDAWADHLAGARMTARSEADYRNPTLIIRLQPGSPWRAELHMRRAQIRRAINERMKSEFIRAVIIK